MVRPAAARGGPTIAAVVALLAAACDRGPKTPEQAYERLAEATRARDAAKLFSALDEPTRWSWMSVHRAHREAYDITLSNIPEGQERDRQLRRFEAAALSESARELFAKELPATVWTDLEAALGPPGTSPRFAHDGDRSVATTPAGAKLVFRRGQKRPGWGYAGLADEAEGLKRRAIADLDLMRASAADYERAAARGRP